MKTHQVLSTSLTSASVSSSPEACFFYFVSLGRFTEVSFLVFPWVFPYSHINMEVQTPTKIPQFFPYSQINMEVQTPTKIPQFFPDSHINMEVQTPTKIPQFFPDSHINMEVQTPTKIPQFFPYSHIFRWVSPWVFPTKIPRVSNQLPAYLSGIVASKLDVHAALLPTINILPWLNWGRAQVQLV